MSTGLLCLHGFTGAPSVFDTVLEHIDGAALVLRPGLLGHTRRPPAGWPRSFDVEVQRIAAELDPSRRWVVLGYSLGARLALHCMLRFPTLFGGAVLIGPNPGLRTEEEFVQRRAWDAEWSALLRDEGIETFVNRWEALPLWDSQRALPEELRQSQRELRISQDPEGLALSLDVLGLSMMAPTWSVLPRLQTAVTVMSGSLDAKFERLGGELVDALPNGRHVVVEGCGHNVLLEAPEAVTREVNAAIRSASSP